MLGIGSGSWNMDRVCLGLDRVCYSVASTLFPGLVISLSFLDSDFRYGPSASRKIDTGAVSKAESSFRICE